MDTLIHIAFIMHLQLGDHALEKIARDYMDLEGEDSVEENVPVMDAKMDEEEPMEEMDADAEEDIVVEILDAPPAVFQTQAGRRKP